MNETLLVVGIEYRQSKSGKPYSILHTSQPFTDSKYGIGSRTSATYVGDKCPRDLKVGDSVELDYGCSFSGQAYVKNVRIVSADVPTVEIKK